MDWIKAKYDRVILLAAAFILIASTAFVFLSTKGFPEIFANYQAAFNKSISIKPLDVEAINQAKELLANPVKWKAGPSPLLVSRRILLKADGTIEEFGNNEIVPGVPNKWFIDNDIDPLQPDVMEMDPDSDRFTNKEEFAGKSNPRDAGNHPPYSDKLFLKKFIKKPFRIVFSARDGETFQINTIDLHQPTQFLKVKDPIAGTKFMIDTLAIKECVNSLGTPVDCSELTIKNVETGEQMVLVVGRTTDSPDVYAQFTYLWDNSEFTKKKNEEFQLKPDDKTTYKLIDISETEAVIKQLGNDAEIKIPLQP